MTEPGVGTNRYAYSFNDPVNGMDPGGNNVIKDEVEEFDPFNILEGGGGGFPSGGGGGGGPGVGLGQDLRAAGGMFLNWITGNGSGGDASAGGAPEQGRNLSNTLPTEGTAGATSANIAAIESARENGRAVMFHYTSDEGLAGILASQTLLPSTKAANPKDARYGSGQYVSDIVPGTKSNASLSQTFIRNRFQGQRFRNFVAIDVTGLPLVNGRRHVYVIPNEGPLPLAGRIVATGVNQIE